MNKYILVTLSVIGGILSGLAWSGWCSGLILLVSLVPFFLIENYLAGQRLRYSANAYFIYVLPGFLIFSILTLGWIRVASLVAAVGVIMGMTFLMSFTAWLAHYVRLRAGNITAIAALLSFWLAFEFLCLNVDIITPWINLGNGLAKDILFIQWYDTTGVAGGSLWILISNILLSVFLIRSMNGLKRRRLYIILWVLVIIIPSAVSLLKYFNNEDESSKPSEVVVVQPDFDPYNEKFTIPFRDQLASAIRQAEKSVTQNTEWVIMPETVVDDPVNEADYSKNIYLNMSGDFALLHPGVSIIQGMTTFRVYPASPQPPTGSARKIEKDNSWYDHFNAAVQIDTGKQVSFYHKSKLVPGIEKQFISGPGKILSTILPYLGGSQWGYGIQKERTTFKHHISGMRAAPVICYESIYGKYITGYVRNGANAIFIITNDGWWKNTNGYKQHFSFASIRAIETRRPVARAANTGISGIIDKKGRVVNKSEWWTPSAIRGEIIPGYSMTPYVRFGDYLMVAGTISGILIFITVFIALPLYKIFRSY
jgi:apolipoprotein N-acyltransferase